jgi:hypothetical protein
MLEIDTKSMPMKEILNKPGKLASKIVYKKLIENNYDLWFISDEDGEKVFFASLGNVVGGTVAWTTKDLAIGYINRKDIKKTLIRSFGTRIMLSKMSLYHMQGILEPSNAEYISTIIVNPNSKDFFVPIALPFFQKFSSLLEDDIEDELDYSSNQFEICQMKLDKETKYFVEDHDSDDLLNI